MVLVVVEVDSRELHRTIRPGSSTRHPTTCCHVPPTLRGRLGRNVYLMGLICAGETDGKLGFAVPLPISKYSIVQYICIGVTHVHR